MTKTYEAKCFVPKGRLPYDEAARLANLVYLSGDSQLKQMIDMGPEKVSVKDLKMISSILHRSL